MWAQLDSGKRDKETLRNVGEKMKAGTILVAVELETGC